MRSGVAIGRAGAGRPALPGGGRRRPRCQRRGRPARASATAPPTACCRRCAATGSSPRTPARSATTSVRVWSPSAAAPRRGSRFDRLLPHLAELGRDDRRVGEPRHPGRRRGARRAARRLAATAALRPGAGHARPGPRLGDRQGAAGVRRRPGGRGRRARRAGRVHAGDVDDAATRLLADLEATRRRGWALNDGERDVGVRTMAAPLLDDDGRPWAGVAIQGPAVRLPDERLDDARRRARRTRRRRWPATHVASPAWTRRRGTSPSSTSPAFASRSTTRHRRVRRRPRRRSTPSPSRRRASCGGSPTTAASRRATCAPTTTRSSSSTCRCGSRPSSSHDFVFHTAHTPFLRRRREWFERMTRPSSCAGGCPPATVPDGRGGAGAPRPAAPRRGQRRGVHAARPPAAARHVPTANPPSPEAADQRR